MSNALRVDVWSDIACPWCYIGKRRLEAALRRFPHRDRVEVVWRAFELDPQAPRERDPATPYAARLAQKYGSSQRDAEDMLANMTRVAADEGLDFHFERIRPGNTFDAHRLLHLAAARGRQGEVQERFFRGYLTEGAAIGHPEALARLSTEAGLDPAEVRDVLDGAAFGDRVRADQAQARALGIGGVPFFVLGGRYGLSGAQPVDVLLDALSQAWSETAAAATAVPPAAGAAGEGSSCGPEDCD